jgi:hypothetical protein
MVLGNEKTYDEVNLLPVILYSVVHEIYIIVQHKTTSTYTSLRKIKFLLELPSLNPRQFGAST